MLDKATFYIQIILEIFGAAHPIRVGFGMLLGLMTFVGFDVLSAVYPESLALAVIANRPLWHFVVFGLTVVFLHFFATRTQVSEANLGFLNLIEALLQKSNVSGRRKSEYYLKMAEKAVEAFDPKAENKVDVGQAAARAAEAADGEDG